MKTSEEILKVVENRLQYLENVTEEYKEFFTNQLTEDQKKVVLSQINIAKDELKDLLLFIKDQPALNYSTLHKSQCIRIEFFIKK
jgi:hypothetical protein